MHLIMKKLVLYSPLILAFVLNTSFNAYAATDLKMTDVSGDDYGDGSLSYPERFDFQPGDLDLLGIEVRKSDDGIWMIARFRNYVRDPKDARVDVGPEALSNFYRKGFFAFNIDLYIDQDRVSGSGNSFTLPGRHASIATDYAWEKAVILSPRPELIQNMLVAGIAGDFKHLDKPDIKKKLQKLFFFPTKVKVRKRKIEFFVPRNFLGNGDPADWAYTAFVTGAKTLHGVSIDGIYNSGLENLQLGVMQPQGGKPMQTFSVVDSRKPVLPIIDLLAAGGGEQEKQLAPGRGAELSGVSTVSAKVGAGVLVTSIAAYLGQPGQKAGAVPVSGPRDASPITDATAAGAISGADVAAPAPISNNSVDAIKSRLQKLDKLRDQGVITDKEYEHNRQRILNEL